MIYWNIIEEYILFQLRELPVYEIIMWSNKTLVYTELEKKYQLNNENNKENIYYWM